jgi:hypothetical protein
VLAGPWPTLYIVDEASQNILLVDVEAAAITRAKGLASPIGTVLNGNALLQEKGYVLYETPAAGGAAKRVLSIPDGPGYPRTNGMAGPNFWWFFVRGRALGLLAGSGARARAFGRGAALTSVTTTISPPAGLCKPPGGGFERKKRGHRGRRLFGGAARHGVPDLRPCVGVKLSIVSFCGGVGGSAWAARAHPPLSAAAAAARPAARQQ